MLLIFSISTFSFADIEIIADGELLLPENHKLNAGTWYAVSKEFIQKSTPKIVRESSAPNGKKIVVVELEPFAEFLVKGLTLKEGRITIDRKLHENTRSFRGQSHHGIADTKPNFPLDLSFANGVFQPFGKALDVWPPEIVEYGVMANVDGINITIKSETKYEKPFKLIWLNDLNGDEKCDFLIDLSTQKGKSRETLFLSRKVNDDRYEYYRAAKIPFKD